MRLLLQAFLRSASLSLCWGSAGNMPVFTAEKPKRKMGRKSRKRWRCCCSSHKVKVFQKQQGARFRKSISWPHFRGNNGSERQSYRLPLAVAQSRHRRFDFRWRSAFSNRRSSNTHTKSKNAKRAEYQRQYVKNQMLKGKQQRKIKLHKS